MEEFIVDIIIIVGELRHGTFAASAEYYDEEQVNGQRDAIQGPAMSRQE